jgi:NAD dependent epimerase/dehydratase
VSKFWKDRQVLVTGADGFIGSHLVERLCAEGARVRAFCFYNSNGSLGWLDRADAAVSSGLDVRLGDIRDGRFVEEACRGIEVVFHLAALVAIPYSYATPEGFVDTNVRGTLNVLEGTRKAGCTRVVHTSTSEVYGTPAELPIRESHPLHGQSPYSASKIAADKLAEAFHCSFGSPVVVLRPFNTYGPRQSTRAVLPTMLVQLLKGRREVLLGSLAPRRDLTFVADTVKGFLLAGEAKGIEGDVIHLGTGRAVSIGQLFEMACQVLGVKAVAVCEEQRVRPQASEVMALLSDPSFARERLGWSAETSLEQGIERTAQWIAARLESYQADHYHV